MNILKPNIEREFAVGLVREYLFPYFLENRLGAFCELSLIQMQMAESDPEIAEKNIARLLIVEAQQKKDPILYPYLAQELRQEGMIPTTKNSIPFSNGDTRYIGETIRGKHICNMSMMGLFSIDTKFGELNFSYVSPEYDVLLLSNKLCDFFDAIFRDKFGLTDKEFRLYTLPYLIAIFRILERLIHFFDGSNNRTLNEWMKLQFQKVGGDLNVDSMKDPNLGHNLSIREGEYGLTELDAMMVFVSIYGIPLYYPHARPINMGYYDLRRRSEYLDEFIPEQRFKNITIREYSQQVVKALSEEIETIPRTLTFILQSVMNDRNDFRGNRRDIERSPLMNYYLSLGKKLVEHAN